MECAGHRHYSENGKDRPAKEKDEGAIRGRIEKDVGGDRLYLRGIAMYSGRKRMADDLIRIFHRRDGRVCGSCWDWQCLLGYG